jgi:hypothetical protein
MAEVLHEQTRAVRLEPGCLYIQGCRSKKDPFQFLLFSRWSGRAAFQVQRGPSGHGPVHRHDGAALRPSGGRAPPAGQSTGEPTRSSSVAVRSRTTGFTLSVSPARGEQHEGRYARSDHGYGISSEEGGLRARDRARGRHPSPSR